MFGKKLKLFKEKKYIEITATKIIKESAEIVEIAATRDLTNQHALRELRKHIMKLKELCDNISDAIIIYD